MLLVLITCALIWFGGARFGLPARVRGALIALTWAAMLIARMVLPGYDRRDVVEWALIGVVVVAVWAYARWIGGLKRRAAKPAAPDAAPGSFGDAELSRYSRHILLHELGGPGQKRLKTARVLVIGAGGLGAPVLQYLAAAGVGTIGVIDDDEVDASNLHRQVIHTDAAIGTPKVRSAAEAMAAQNPFVTVRPYQRRLTEVIAEDLFGDYDLILDGSDNFDTRYLANRTAVKLDLPLIAGALTQWEGQLSTWHPAKGGPCYECIFPERPAPGMVPSCAEAGVVGPLPGVIGSMMALEAVKELTGAGEGLIGRMLIWDGLNVDARTIRLKRRADCPVCGASQGG